jgi:hypothetical protein
MFMLIRILRLTNRGKGLQINPYIFKNDTKHRIDTKVSKKRHIIAIN